MIHGMVQLHVKDFDQFVRMIEESSSNGTTAKYGMLRTKIYRNTEDPNLVNLVVEWETDQYIAQFIEDTQADTMQHVDAQPIPFNVSEYYEFECF